jgi:hypothetical protein
MGNDLKGGQSGLQDGNWGWSAWKLGITPAILFLRGVLSVLLSHLEPYDEFHLLRRRETPTVAPTVRGIDWFTIASGSISGWMKRLKTGNAGSGSGAALPPMVW